MREILKDLFSIVGTFAMLAIILTYEINKKTARLKKILAR